MPEYEPYPYAELAHSYTAEGESHSVTYTKAFWFQASAKAFASRFHYRATLLFVTVRGYGPSLSFVKESGTLAVFQRQLDEPIANSSRSECAVV